MPVMPASAFAKRPAMDEHVWVMRRQDPRKSRLHAVFVEFYAIHPCSGAWQVLHSDSAFARDSRQPVLKAPARGIVLGACFEYSRIPLAKIFIAQRVAVRTNP